MKAKQKENTCYAMETTQGQLKCYINVTLYSILTYIHTRVNMHFKGYVRTPIYLIQEKRNLSHITEKLILIQIYIITSIVYHFNNKGTGV